MRFRHPRNGEETKNPRRLPLMNTLDDPPDRLHPCAGPGHESPYNILQTSINPFSPASAFAFQPGHTSGNPASMKGPVADPHYALTIDTDCSRTLDQKSGLGEPTQRHVPSWDRQRDAVKADMPLSGQHNRPP